MINYCHCFWCSNYSKFDQWALLQVSPFVLLTLVYLSSSTSLLSGYKTEFKPHDNRSTLSLCFRLCVYAYCTCIGNFWKAYSGNCSWGLPLEMGSGTQVPSETPTGSLPNLME